MKPPARGQWQPGRPFVAHELSVGPRLRTARILTLIAIAPQLFFLYLTLTDGEASWTAPVAAFAYAAFIFSFLGGYWWGVALATRPEEPFILLVAIMPMLLSFALFMPWVWGWSWPGQQLIILGMCIIIGVLVDWRLLKAFRPAPRWLTTRLTASLGLGITTIAIGYATLSHNG